jgi:hypothetical protein
MSAFLRICNYAPRVAVNEVQLLKRKVEKLEGKLEIALKAIERLQLIAFDATPRDLGREKSQHKVGVSATHSG